MTRLSALLALTAAAVAVSANPIVVRDSPITLSIARRFNTTGVVNVLEADLARAKVLKARGQAAHAAAPLTARSAVNVAITNTAVVYSASVGVGSPATSYDLLIDTGSSNTWVGAGKAYVKTKTSVDTGNTVSVSYGSGSFSGEEYTDTVTIGSLVIKNQGIGVASQSQGFTGYDGILGIGPVDLTEDTTSNGGEVPTVTNNAYSAGSIPSNSIGISFEPTTSESETNGELTFGGVDTSKYTGTLSYVPITSTYPASEYVGINQAVTYGSSGTSILSSTAGITDTGTTLVLLASNAFSAYKKATGATMDSATGLLKLTSSKYASLQSLYFHIGSNTYEFTANAQIWPRALNSVIGGTSGNIYLVTANLGTPSGEGLDFINGYTFLERFYYVYDAGNSRVGFATTSYTDATTN